jgi:hypothetical protein
MSGICERCGYDVDKIGPVTRGDCTVLPGGTIRLRGGEVRLSPFEHELFFALMRTDFLRLAVLADRLASTENAVSTHICRINQKFRQVGANPPVASTRYYHIV